MERRSLQKKDNFSTRIRPQMMALVEEAICHLTGQRTELVIRHGLKPVFGKGHRYSS